MLVVIRIGAVSVLIRSVTVQIQRSRWIVPEGVLEPEGVEVYVMAGAHTGSGRPLNARLRPVYGAARVV